MLFLCRVLCCVVLYSYLGYGLMAARAKVIEAGKDDPNHPCFAKGSSLKYSYAGAQESSKASAQLRLTGHSMFVRQLTWAVS
jgi:hypothetical protein